MSKKSTTMPSLKNQVIKKNLNKKLSTDLNDYKGFQKSVLFAVIRGRKSFPTYQSFFLNETTTW